MKKYSLLSVLLLTTNFCFTQNFNGFAIYNQYNVVGLTIAILGIVATFFGSYGWCFEPADPEDHH